MGQALQLASGPDVLEGLSNRAGGPVVLSNCFSNCVLSSCPAARNFPKLSFWNTERENGSVPTQGTETSQGQLATGLPLWSCQRSGCSPLRLSLEQRLCCPILSSLGQPHPLSEVCVWITCKSTPIPPVQTSLLRESLNSGSWLRLPSGYFICLGLGSMHGVGTEQNALMRKGGQGLVTCLHLEEVRLQPCFCSLSLAIYLGRPVTW